MSKQPPNLLPPLVQIQQTPSPKNPSTIPPPSSPQTTSVGMGLLGPGHPSRSESSLNVSHLQRISTAAGRDFMTSKYPHEYTETPALDQLVSIQPGAGTPDISPTHTSSGITHAQKRAYRQRRKDPSCDACRERKCDATDYNSCSECQSRNVKCEFTKETNRRMSSIKQVQDLEKQLDAARQQISRLQSILGTEGALDINEDIPDVSPFVSPEPSSKKRRRQSVMNDFSAVRRDFEILGRGLIQGPVPGSTIRLENTLSAPNLPPRHVADHLLDQFYKSFHLLLPILEWSSFSHRCDQIYRQNSFEGVPKEWVGLFFATLSCGALNGSVEEAREWFETTKFQVDLWVENPSMDSVRSAVLASIFLVEVNSRSTGWTILGHAIRAAQDLGLHRTTDIWSSIDEEMRRCLWWSIYILDRTFSLELGRPPLINDDDCDLGLPNLMEDDYSAELMVETIPSPFRPSKIFHSILQIARCDPRLFKTLRSPVLHSSQLNALDEQFDICANTFPSCHRIPSNDVIDLPQITAAINLQNRRLLLHRHNLSPRCRPEARIAAIDECFRVAGDTARLLSGAVTGLTESPYSIQRQSSSISMASAFLCTHIWRCTLFLCFRGDYDLAMICIRTSAAIGSTKPVNLVCGRYLEFFLQCLLPRLERGEGPYLDQSEEMMAYVSGDLQTNLGQAWIWQDWEGGGSRARLSDEIPDIRSSTAKLDAWREWDRWDWIIATVQRLLHDQRQGQQPLPSTENTPPTTQGDDLPRTSKAMKSAQVSPGGTNRISIADII